MKDLEMILICLTGLIIVWAVLKIAQWVDSNTAQKKKQKETMRLVLERIERKKKITAILDEII